MSCPRASSCSHHWQPRLKDIPFAAPYLALAITEFLHVAVSDLHDCFFFSKTQHGTNLLHRIKHFTRCSLPPCHGRGDIEGCLESVEHGCFFFCRTSDRVYLPHTLSVMTSPAAISCATCKNRAASARAASAQAWFEMKQACL